jgi:hypothetical protein
MYRMQSSVGQTFSVLRFTGIVEAVSDSGALIDLARVSKSGFTRTGLGHLHIQFPCLGPWRAEMTLAIPPEYHQPATIDEIRRAAFSALGISHHETWTVRACPPCKAEMSIEPGEDYIMLSS